MSGDECRCDNYYEEYIEEKIQLLELKYNLILNHFKKLIKDDNCAICHEKLTDDICIYLCSHIYHLKCSRLLYTCPLCRVILKKIDHF